MAKTLSDILNEIRNKVQEGVARNQSGFDPGTETVIIKDPHTGKTSLQDRKGKFRFTGELQQRVVFAVYAGLRHVLGTAVPKAQQEAQGDRQKTVPGGEVGI